jgi:hypothetical protein
MGVAADKPLVGHLGKVGDINKAVTGQIGG